MFTRLHAAGTMLAALALASAHGAQAQYPAKPIRFIVPYAPGGGTDIIARTLAQRVGHSLNQSVVVDNRAGAGGAAGAEMTVRAAPDGYTLAMFAASYPVTAGLYKIDYDPVQDIDPVSLIGTSGLLVALHPSLEARNIKEFLETAKAKSGRLNYGSSGTGGITHLATELFAMTANITLTHIPYKGNAPALNDLLAGQTQLIFGSLLATLPHAKSGRLRGIAVTMRNRSSAIPDLPTVAESGLAGYEVETWYGVVGPRGLPAAIVRLWHDEIIKILKLREMRDRLTHEGLEAVGSTPAEFRQVVKRDVEKWAKVIKAVKLTPQS